MTKRAIVIVENCTPGTDSTCIATPQGGSPASTINNLAAMHEFLRDFKLRISMIEDYPGYKEVGKPILRNLVNVVEQRFTPTLGQIDSVLLSEVEVETEWGWFFKTRESQSGLVIDTLSTMQIG